MTNLTVRALLFAFFIFFFLPNNGQAQSRKRLRELDKKEAQRNAEEEASNDAAKKRHLDIQSKSTRKEMRRLKKMSERHNTNRRAPIWKRSKRRKR
jgi:hypothetical protein